MNRFISYFYDTTIQLLEFEHENNTIVSFIPFVVFDFELSDKVIKYYVIFVYIFQGKMGKTEKNLKENHTTKVTKTPKTKRQKYGMNETIYLNSKRSEQFYTLLLEVPIRNNTLGQLK